jgi:hypothetical protein
MGGEVLGIPLVGSFFQVAGKSPIDKMMMVAC